MKKLIVTLVSTSLVAVAGIALASNSADLALDANRMFFHYWAPGVDSGDFQVLPGNVHNPIVLPCDVTSFGGGLDIDYLGAGPTATPQFTATFFDDQNQPITSHGCLGDTNLPSVAGTFNPIAAGAVQNDGYMLVSSTHQFCQWLFQPSDLPADKVVRIHEAIAAYPTSQDQATPLSDPNPANNARDIYVRRACSCQ